MVPFLYRNIRQIPEIQRERYRSMFKTRRFETDWNTWVDITEVTKKSYKQIKIMVDYRQSHDASLKLETDVEPLAEDRPGMQSYLRSYKVDLGGLLKTAAPMVQSMGGNGTHRDEKGQVRVIFKKIKK